MKIKDLPQELQEVVCSRKVWERDIPELSLNQLYEKIGYRFKIKNQ